VNIYRDFARKIMKSVNLVRNSCNCGSIREIGAAEPHQIHELTSISPNFKPNSRILQICGTSTRGAPVWVFWALGCVYIGFCNLSGLRENL
jgi:hypothetical protein